LGGKKRLTHTTMVGRRIGGFFMVLLAVCGGVGVQAARGGEPTTRRSQDKPGIQGAKSDLHTNGGRALRREREKASRDQLFGGKENDTIPPLDKKTTF